MMNIVNKTYLTGLLTAVLLISLMGLTGCDSVDELFQESEDQVANTSLGADMAPTGEASGVSLRQVPPPSAHRDIERHETGNQHTDFGDNYHIDAAVEPISTFSADVNTASYTMTRSALNSGRLPDPDSVRTEEFINFFDYGMQAPEDAPFSIHTEIAPSYFGTQEHVQRHLMQVGVRARDVSVKDMKPNNLVFLVDVSGSMSPEVRLPLAKKSLHIMLEQLRPTDTVAIQTYASGSDTVLEPTPVSDLKTIEEAIDGLAAQGGTNGEGGIRDAYDMAEKGFVEDGNNRVVILTDGDFNVGKRGDDIVDMVKSYREREIALTSVGFGHGNHNDAVMERLAREGSGNYFYIDTLDEARRIFGTNLASTLEIIGSDVRFQVEFDENVVNNYRLVGYEKRVLDNEDFEKESTNAAEVGPGHDVTAFYEIEIHEDAEHSETPLAEIRVRYKERLLGDSLEIREQVATQDVQSDFFDASPAFRFAAAVAAFAEILRESPHAKGAQFEEVQSVAADARFGQSSEQDEFIELVSTAHALWQ